MNHQSSPIPQFRTFIRGEKTLLLAASDVVNNLCDLPNTIKPEHMRDYAILAHNIYCRDSEKVPAEGWYRLPIALEPTHFRSSRIIQGLLVEAWSPKIQASRQLAVLVFRGTHSLWDWVPNMRWFLKLSRRVVYSDHFVQVADQVDSLIRQIQQILGPDVIIESAGHSLGGGLAQYAAYASGQIKTVYAFNTSPVTGYRSVSRRLRSGNCRGIVTFRIYQTGEVLSYMNRTMQLSKSLFNFVRRKNVDPRIVELELKCKCAGGAIDLHSMQLLATNLDKLHRKPIMKSSD